MKFLLPTLSIHMLKSAEETTQTVTQILTQGFFDDPMITFLFPDPPTRGESLSDYFRLFASDAVQRGKVQIAPDDQGAICWYPHDVDVFNEEFDALVAELTDVIWHHGGTEAVERFEQLNQALDLHTPDRTHCEVFWIVVLPEARGKGVGGTLLTPVTRFADESQVGCYLVSSNPRNISFYERHGFQKDGPIPINGVLTLMGMWRESATPEIGSKIK